ncbi:MAG: protein kinase [Burkholderiales bacterium]|nr:MAG: protein kinase [Burkholderiales bacterium]
MSDPAVETPRSGSTLPPGTRLNEFEIVRLLAAGSVGGLYLAEDRLLGRRVAIKEFLPEQIALRTADGEVRPRSESTAAAFDAGRRSLLEEARLLAQVEHPALVSVLRFWEANGTAYVVMPYYEGQVLREALAAQPHLGTEQWLRRLAARMLGALAAMHAAGAVHGDLSPETVLILPGDQPMIVGLGATRRKLAETAPGLTVMVKPGFAPIEQYATDLPYGPWSDVYGVAAILYLGVTGKPPAPAITRVAGKALVPAADFGHAGFSATFLEAIDRGLALEGADRPQSAQALRELLGIDDATRGDGRMVTGIAPTELRAAAAAGTDATRRTAGEAAEPSRAQVPTAPTAAGAGSEAAAAEPSILAVRASAAEPAPGPGAGAGGGTADRDAASAAAGAPPAAGSGSARGEQATQGDALAAVSDAKSRLREQRRRDPQRAASRTAPRRRLPMVPIAGGLAVALLIALVWLLLQSPSKTDQPIAPSPVTGDVSQPPQAGDAAAAKATEPSPQPDAAPAAAAGAGPVTGDGSAAVGGAASGGGTGAVPGAAAGTASGADSAPAGADRATATAAPSRPRPPAGTATAPSQPRPAPQPAAQPVPPASGTVLLSVRPWGEVFVDGQSRGVTPPLKRLPLAPGEHVIEIRNPAGSPYRRTIRIDASQQLTLTHDF